MIRMVLGKFSPKPDRNGPRRMNMLTMGIVMPLPVASSLASWKANRSKSPSTWDSGSPNSASRNWDLSKSALPSPFFWPYISNYTHNIK